ncbi:UNVERIFIED_CONTAM: hypothetical protein K2H54_056334 [Gekko kuhli]
MVISIAEVTGASITGGAAVVTGAKAFLEQLQNPENPGKPQEDDNANEKDNNQRSHGEISSSFTEEESDSELGTAAPKTPKTSRDYYLRKKKEK